MKPLNKKAITIILVALIIIALAYYFLIGKKDSSESYSTSGSSSGGSSSGSSSGTSTAAIANTFPLQWGVKNSYTANLQRRLNQTISAYKAQGKKIVGYESMTLLTDDGVLGDKTASAAKAMFPNIGNNIALTHQVSQAEYNAIINSKVSA